MSKKRRRFGDIHSDDNVHNMKFKKIQSCNKNYTCKICKENEITVTEEAIVSVICSYCLLELTENPRKCKK